MKVVGTGSPVALTLRLSEREIKHLSDELEHRHRVAGDALQTAIDQGRGFTAVRDDGRPPADVMLGIVAMLEVIAQTIPNAQGRYVITGPTWLLGQAIRGVSIEVTEQLAETLRRFVDEAAPSAAELRDAVRDAAAWSETLIGLDHAEKFGLDS
jgi:hypothetical protein